MPSSTGSAYALTSQEANSFYYENSAATGTFQRAFVSQQSASFVAQSQAPTQQIVRPPITVNNQQFQGKAEIYLYEKPLNLYNFNFHNYQVEVFFNNSGMRYSSVMVVEPNRSQPNTSVQFQSIASSPSVSDQHSQLDQQSQSQLSHSQNKVSMFSLLI